MRVLTTHLDDLLWASIGMGGTIIDRLLKRFEVGRRESGRLRFCGKQFDKSGNDVLIEVIDNTSKITYIDIKSRRIGSTRIRLTEMRSASSDQSEAVCRGYLGNPGRIFYTVYRSSRVRYKVQPLPHCMRLIRFWN